MVATQGGVSVDTRGGLNLSMPIDLALTIVDNYGEIKDPKVNIDVSKYSGTISCSWSKQPTFGLL